MTKKKLITEVRQQFQASRVLVQPLIDRRNYNLNLYTAFSAVQNTENADNIKEFIPYTATLLDNTLPLLVAQLPQSKVSPRNTQKDFTASKLMDQLITFTFDSNDFHEEFPLAVQEAMLSGDHFTKVMWNPNPDKNYPLLTFIDSNNVSVHAAKLTIDDDYPLFIRREMTKQQMREETNWDDDAINSLTDSNLKDMAYRKKQMQKLGLPPEIQKGSLDGQEEKWNLYEVVERWGMMEFKEDERKMGYVVVANGKTLLNPEPFFDDLEPYESPFANNVMPFAHLPYKRIPNSFFSLSFVDPIVQQQVEMNDLEAMKKSNYIRRNNPPIKILRSANVDLKSAKFLAGMPWSTDDMNGIEPMMLEDLSVSIENTQMMLRRTMMNVTGATDILMQSPDKQGSGGGGKHSVQSAAHAQLLQESIKSRFTLQAQNIDRYIERIGKLLINLWQDKRYWVGMKGGKVALAIADDEGRNAITEVTNKDIQGELDFIVTSASSIAKSQAAQATQAANLFQLFIASPMAQSMNFEPLVRDIFEKSGYDYNEIQKPKASNIPAMNDKLQQLIALTQEPNFKQAPRVEQLKVIQQIQSLKQQIQQLSQQGGQQQPGQPGNPQQPQQSMAGQQLQPQAVQ